MLKVELDCIEYFAHGTHLLERDVFLMSCFLPTGGILQEAGHPELEI